MRISRAQTLLEQLIDDGIRITADADTRVNAQLELRRANGLASKLDVLDARRTELKDRRAALLIQSARYVATVGLVRASGGGWDGETANAAPVGKSVQQAIRKCARC